MIMKIFNTYLLITKIIGVAFIFTLIGIEIGITIRDWAREKRESRSDEESEPDPAEFDEDGG